MANKKNISLAQVLNLKDAIEYSKDAIVSKTILDKKTGTLTLFAFAAGQALSEHTAPFDALIQVLDGQAQIKIGGKAHKVSAGEIVLMPANIPHAVKAVRKFKMLLTMIRS